MAIYGNSVGGQGNVKQAENADTLDGKHASEFAIASDVEKLEMQVGDTSVSEQITSAIIPINTSLDNKLDKSGGVMTGNLTLYKSNAIAETLFAKDVTLSDDECNNGACISHGYNENNAAVLEFYGVTGDEPVILRNISDPYQVNDSANKRYVDSKVLEYLPLSGGSIDGDLSIGGNVYLSQTARLSAEQDISDEYGQSPLKIFTDQDTFEYTIGGGRIGGLTEQPSSDTDAVNKAYVDNAIANIDIPSGKSIISYTKPTEVPLENGAQYIIYGAEATSFTLTIGTSVGDNSVTYNLPTARSIIWFLWVQTADSGGSIIPTNGERGYIIFQGDCSKIKISTPSTQSYIVIKIS